jgi:hypothetical protein
MARPKKPRSSSSKKKRMTPDQVLAELISAGRAGHKEPR